MRIPGLAPTAAVLTLALLAWLVPLSAGAVAVERVVSPGGIEAWMVRDTSNPIIAFRFAFRGGGALDPDGKEGLASMVSALLDEGAGDLDSMAFQQTLEDRAIRLSFDAGKDSFGGNLTTLVKNRETAFRLLRLALTEPRFDDEPVSRIREQILAGLRRDLEDPDSISGRALFKALYPDHPYGRPTDGTIESVSAITATDLRTFVRERLGLDNLVVGVVGDITGEEVARVLDETFGRLPKTARPWSVPEVEPEAGRTIVIDKDVPQSSVLFAGAGLKRDDPDYYTAFVMNHILGGGSFTSRLYSEIREKRGLVYSVYSTLHPMDHSALILGSAATANARVGETLRVVGEEWDRMAAEGISADELMDAKTYLTGSFPLRFTSNGRIASILVGMQIEELGIDYLDRRNALIEAVTRRDVKRVAARLLDRRRLITVVVGKPDGVKNSH